MKETHMASRRRLMALLALALVALLPLVAGPALAADPPVYAPVGPGDVYLALGDSLATGDEEPANSADEGNLPGYPVNLHTIMRRTLSISLTTGLAVSGETSASMRATGGQLEQAVTYIGAQRAAGRRVSPVTLSVGGNDMVDTFLGQSPQTVTDTLVLYRANLEVILDTLLASLTVNGQRTGDLLLMNYYNPYPGLTIVDFPPVIDLPPGQGPIVTDVEVPRFNQIIVEEATERGIPVVDSFSAFRGREASLTFVRFPYNFFDQANLRRNFDYHPRSDGHNVLALGFAEATGYTLKLPRLYLPLARQ